MKKILLLLSIAIAWNVSSQTSPRLPDIFKKQTHPSVSAQKTAAIVNLRDSSYQWHWDNAAATWTLSIKVTFTYNTSYEETASLTSHYNLGTWQYNSQTINYVYDSNHNLLSKTQQHRITAAWENYSKTTMTYDAFNNLLTEVQQDWDVANSVWVNSYAYSYTYNSSNLPVTFLAQLWNAGTSSWINANRGTLTYNASDEYTSYMLEMWNTNTSLWENSAEIINFVYANGDLISFEEKLWDAATSSYQPSYIQQNTYDAAHHLLTSDYQDWNANTNMYYHLSRDFFTYDSFDNQITYINQQWYNPTSSWRNANRIYDYYTSLVGIKENSSQNSLMSLYPNPVINDITISTDNHQLFTNITITNALGKVTLSENMAGTSSAKLNLDNLEPGIYFISLKGEDFTGYQKIVKQ